MSTIFKIAPLFLFLISCKGSKATSEFVDKNSSYKIVVFENGRSLNNFSNQLEISSTTSFETTNESVFAEPTKVLISKHNFYLYDRSLQQILSFDLNGKFLGKLDKKGKGPEEYLDLRDFQIITDKRISILTYDKVMYYDLGFKYVDSYRIGINENPLYYLNPTQFYETNDMIYLWNGAMGFERNKDKMPYLMYSVKNRKILNGYFPFTQMEIGKNRYTDYNNRVLITPPVGCDTIYSIDNQKLKIAFKVDFGKYNLPIDLLKGTTMEEGRKVIANMMYNTDYCLEISNIVETNKYLYFQFSQKGNVMQGLFSKSTGKCVTGLLHPFTKIVCAENDLLIAMVDPILLDYCIKNIDKNNVSQELKSAFLKMSFNIHDNPIAIKYSLKPF